jgi:hypothetical protein
MSRKLVVANYHDNHMLAVLHVGKPPRKQSSVAKSRASSDSIGIGERQADTIPVAWEKVGM